jgi:lipopolysaccharide transport system ATP-binding protein
MRIPPAAAGFTLLCVLEDPAQRNIFHLRIDSSDLKLSTPWRENYTIKVRLPPLWLEPGLYSLWFKALYWGETVQSRVLSDVYYLDAAGRSSGWNAVLSPTPEWCFQPVDSPAMCEPEAVISNT